MLRQEMRRVHRVFLLINRNLKGPDEPFASIVVRGIVQGLERSEHLYEDIRVLFLKPFAQFLVRRNIGQGISAGDSLDVEP